MASSAGRLIVEIIATTASFQSDLGKASAAAEQHARKIDAAFSGLKGSIVNHLEGIAAAIAGAFGVSAFVGVIKDSIEAEVQLGRLGARAGTTGEQFSAFVEAAVKSHTPLEDIASMSARLSKALIESQDATTKQAAVFRALGVSGADTARLLANPVAAVKELATRLAPLGESGTGAAAQLILLGRAGGTTAAFLQELAKQQELVASRRQDDIDSAKVLDDKLADLSIRSTNLKTALANALVPTLGDIADALLKAGTGAGSAKEAIDDLTRSGTLKEWAQDAAIAVAVVAESLVFLGRNASIVADDVRIILADLRVALAATNAPKAKPFGSLGFNKEEADRGNAELDAALAARNAIFVHQNKTLNSLLDSTFISDRLKSQFALGDLVRQAQAGAFDDPRDIQNKAALEKRGQQAARDAAALAKRVQDAIKEATRSAPIGEDTTKAALAKNISAIEASLDQEKRVLSGREEFLRAYYAHSDISLQEFFQAREESITEGLGAQKRAFDEEIALTQEFIASRQDILSKGNAKAPGFATAAKDIEDAQRRIIEITRRRTAAEQEASDKSIKLWFDQRQAVEDYAKAAFDATSEQLANQLEHINLLQQGGSLTELDALAKSSEAINAKIALLQSEIAVYEELRKRSSDPLAAQVAQNEIDKLKLRIEGLQVAADALGKKFRDVFETDVADALLSFETGAKSLKDSIKDLGKALQTDLLRIANKSVVEQLFGKGGALFSIPDFFAKAFGGKGAIGGADTGAIALTTAGTSLDLAGVALTSSAAALAASAAALAASAAVSGGIGAFAGASSTFGLGGAFAPIFGGPLADGTSFVPRDMFAFIHKGEAVVPARFNTSIAANNAVGGGSGHTFNTTVNVSGNTTTATAAQVARETGLAVRRATRAAGLGG